MTTGRAVAVKPFPKSFNKEQCEAFLRELEPHLEGDRPRLVFDFSEVRYLDSAGVELLLLCMEEAMKRNGDVKLASVSSELDAILEMTRVDRLFEIYENCSDAMESYHRFPVGALRSMSPTPPERSAASGQRESKIE